MRIGIYADLRNPPPWRRPWHDTYSGTLEVIEEAERLGVGSVWVSEHHGFEDGYLPQPLTFLAAVAARTTRVRLGTAVVLAPLRPAMQMAEDAAIVDILSNGRLDLGLGAGYRAAEYDAYGVDVAQRFPLLETRGREIRELWESGACTPPPIQDPMPLTLCVMGPRGARIAGRLGAKLGWLDAGLLPTYREALAESGHDPSVARMNGLANMVLADDPEAAWEHIRPHAQYQWESYRRYANTPASAPSGKVKTLMEDPLGDPGATRSPLSAKLQILTPDDAEVLLREWFTDLPVEDIYLWSSIAGMPDDLVARNVELIATRLAPALADVGIVDDQSSSPTS